MASARFQVVSLPRPASELRTPKGAQATATIGSQQVRRRFTWRFLAANNRSLATATSTFPDAASCIDAMNDLARGLADSACDYARGDDGLWRWTVTVGGVVVASSHSYQRHVRARLTCETFFSLVRDPTVLDNVQVVYR